MTRPVRKQLTPHQREVFERIRRRSEAGLVSRSQLIGCRGACQHLVEKGWITETEVRGPLGGTTWVYELTPRGEDR